MHYCPAYLGKFKQLLRIMDGKYETKVYYCSENLRLSSLYLLFSIICPKVVTSVKTLFQQVLKIKL